MNYNKTIIVALFSGVIAIYAYAKSDEPQVDNAKRLSGEHGLPKRMRSATLRQPKKEMSRLKR